MDASSNVTEDNEFEDDLANISRMPRLKLDSKNGETILDWWFKMRSTKPSLYAIAITLLSIPCTQVSVERCFSGLALVLTKHRTQLHDETLRNILLIRLNSDLLQRVDYVKALE